MFSGVVFGFGGVGFLISAAARAAHWSESDETSRDCDRVYRRRAIATASLVLEDVTLVALVISAANMAQEFFGGKYKMTVRQKTTWDKWKRSRLRSFWGKTKDNLGQVEKIDSDRFERRVRLALSVRSIER
jgi:hypothetical protein